MQPLYSTGPLASQVEITHQHLGCRIATAIFQQTLIHINIHISPLWTDNGKWLQRTIDNWRCSWSVMVYTVKTSQA